MKKKLISIILFITTFFAYAQEDSIKTYKYTLGISLYDLALKNLNLHTEYRLNNKFTIASAIGFHMGSASFVQPQFTVEIMPRYYLTKHLNGYFITLGYKFTAYDMQQTKQIYRIDSIGDDDNHYNPNLQPDNIRVIEPKRVSFKDNRVIFGMGFLDYFGKKKRFVLECQATYSISFPYISTPLPKAKTNIFNIDGSNYSISYSEYNEWYYEDDMPYFLSKGLVFRFLVGYRF